MVSSSRIGRLKCSSRCSIHTVPSCLPSVFMSPSLCRMLPRYFSSVTCGSWADFMLTLKRVQMCLVKSSYPPFFSSVVQHHNQISLNWLAGQYRTLKKYICTVTCKAFLQILNRLFIFDVHSFKTLRSFDK